MNFYDPTHLAQRAGLSAGVGAGSGCAAGQRGQITICRRYRCCCSPRHRGAAVVTRHLPLPGHAAIVLLRGLENPKRTRANALWVFPLLSCRGQRRLRGGLCCSWQPGLPHPLTVYALWRLDTAGHCAEHPPCRVTPWRRTNPKRGLGSNIGGAGREWIGKGAGGKGGVRSLQYI